MQSTHNIYSVSQLCRETRLLLEGHFLTLTVEGEISNLARPNSGHIYFSLKDKSAQVQCAMFRPQLRKIRFKPENGQHVLLKARVSLYEQRGNFQLIGEHIEPMGEGLLQQQFEQLKSKLFIEGLFDDSQKKALPSLPQKVGIITSASGAAIHDVLTVLKKRFPSLPVLIYPVNVQGELAKNDVVKAIQLANARNECDVLILTRGGGSLEDLWTFNEEIVARAIFDSKIPIISAIGHEVDVTIADFAADLRAATPSAAAEIVSPDQSEWISRLAHLKQQLCNRIENKISLSQQQLKLQQQQLQYAHPGRQLELHAQRLDDCSQRLFQQMDSSLGQQKLALANVHNRLMQSNPQQRIKQLQNDFSESTQRLSLKLKQKISDSKLRMAQCSSALDVLSPLATLSRGYSIVKRKQDDAIISSTVQIKTGEVLNIHLHDGSLQTTVNKIYETN